MEGTVLLLETSMGDIRIRLYDDTPKHRDNIVKLAKEGFYDGTLFHRVIKDFMIQAGDPKSKNASDTATLGSGDTGYTIPAEFVYPKYFHRRGVVAAARMGDDVNPKQESSGCQFYIVTGKKFTEEEHCRFGIATQPTTTASSIQPDGPPAHEGHLQDAKANDTLGLKKAGKTPYSNKPNRKVLSHIVPLQRRTKESLYHDGRSTSSGRAIHRVR